MSRALSPVTASSAVQHGRRASSAPSTAAAARRTATPTTSGREQQIAQTYGGHEHSAGYMRLAAGDSSIPVPARSRRRGRSVERVPATSP